MTKARSLASIAAANVNNATISTLLNTGTLTLPTSTDTIVGRATTDTLSGKTISSAGLPIAGATSGTTTLAATATASGTLTLPAATDQLVGRATTDTLTNKTVNGAFLGYPFENWYINASAFSSSGYTAYVQTNNAVHYLTGTSTGSGTLNISYASGTTLNSVMATGQALTFSLLITNTTAYYANAYQIDGTTTGVTVKWSGGTAPSAGNANSVDVYSFTVLKTASATWTVLAAGPIKYA